MPNQNNVAPRPAGYTVLPFSRLRHLVVDAGWMAKRQHMIHGFLEVDVTVPRRMLHEFKARTGERVSFTAFILACLGQAVEADKRVHAYRTWRNQVIVFDDVDVMLSVEIDLGDGQGHEKFPLSHTVRGVNRRTIRSIHQEIRAVQANPAASVAARGPILSRFYLLPGVVRHTLYRFVLRSPHRIRQYSGTVALTSVGMFGKTGGWGLGMPGHTLAVTLGGIGAKPGVVDGRIEIREYLGLTLSFNHDIVDGAPAARFSQRFQELIEAGFGLDECLHEG